MNLSQPSFKLIYSLIFLSFSLLMFMSNSAQANGNK